MTTTRRSLRSKTAIVDVGEGTLTTTMAPSRKRKSAEIEKFTCFSCTEEKASRMFPDC